MANAAPAFEFRCSWWLEVYIWLLVLFCRLHRCPPDVDKLAKVVYRGLRWRVAGTRRWHA